MIEFRYMNIEQFDSITLEDVENFVTEKQEEHLNLDFKLINRADLTNKHDKKNFAKALSGFANSSGGVIVWGIDARKNSDGIDCAEELKPIENARIFLTKLNSLTGQAVSPIVEGVQHKVVEIENGKGYVLTLIPESSSGPHMAKLRENRYYKRSGDSFYMMEHFDIADMFGRRPHPNLVLNYRIKLLQGGKSIILTIVNEGKGVARSPFFAFRCSGSFQRNTYGLDGSANEGLPRIFHKFNSTEFPDVYVGDANFLLHPGMRYDVAAVAEFASKASYIPNDNVIIEYILSCEDQSSEKRKLTILPEEFNNYEPYSLH